MINDLNKTVKTAENKVEELKSKPRNLVLPDPGGDSEDEETNNPPPSSTHKNKKSHRSNKPERSAKFPDPPILTDGKNPSYDT